MLPSLRELLEAHGLAAAPFAPFEHDGWSGATFATLARGDERFVLKRDRWASDWICRATDDVWLREGVLAACPPRLPDSVDVPFLGAARDGDGYAVLMPDLGGRLLDWSRPIDRATLDTVLAGVARLHAGWLVDPATDEAESLPFPWCPLDARLRLLGPAAAARYVRDGNPVGSRFEDGWAAFRQRADARAVALVDALDADPSPLLDALARLPARALHGDLKLANVGIDDGRVLLIDWQMTLRAPIAVELAWFVVSNVANLPLDPAAVLDLYVTALGDDASDVLGDEAAQRELIWPIGLWLRGWRKALDAEAGLRFPSGASADEDLALWCARAVRAAEAFGVGDA